MALIKILRNVSASDITVKNVVIKAGESYTIPPRKYDIWAEDDAVDPFVSSGDIVVNDGTSDLSIALGLKHLDKLSSAQQIDVDLTPFQNISVDDDVQAVLPELIPSAQINDNNVSSQITNVDFTGNVSVTDEGNGDVTVNIGTASTLGGIYSIFWSESGSAGNEYLETSGERVCNDTPHIIPFRSKVVAYTFSNRDNDGDTNVQIWSVPENSGNSPRTKKDEWSLVNVRTARKTNFPTDIIFEAGDKVVAYLEDTGTNPDDVVFTIYLQILAQDSVSVVESWSGDIDPIGSGDDDDD